MLACAKDHSATNFVQSRRSLLLAPKYWVLEDTDARSELLRFLAELRRGAHGGTPLLVDFSQVEKVFPAATVLFKAELQCLLALPTSNLRFVPPKSNRILQVFKQVGLSGDMGMKNEVRVTRHDVVHWEISSGNEIDNNKIADAMNCFALKVPEVELERLLGGAGEALGNSVEHAYEFRRGTPEQHSGETRWWAFFNFRDEKFFVTLCDLGCGIPVHLPLKHVKVGERIRSIFAKPGLRIPDTAYIRTAAEEGVTATEGANRGKGLPEMLRELAESGHGTLRVFSNSGLVRWDTGFSQAHAFNFDDSIFGTILLWEVKLPKPKDTV